MYVERVLDVYINRKKVKDNDLLKLKLYIFKMLMKMFVQLRMRMMSRQLLR